MLPFDICRIGGFAPDVTRAWPTGGARVAVRI
jgi:hypothetical protein